MLLEMAAPGMGYVRRGGEVGDRLDTDVLAGSRAGMATALVLTGVSTRDEIAGAAARPDLVVNDLPA
jgi:4-nitrophenyl phosphatase